MDIKQIIVSGIAAGIIILIVSMVISMDFQLLFDYNVLTLAGMRAPNDPIMILFFLQPFVIGLAMATLYEYTKKSFEGKAKGTMLGLLGWAIYGIPSAVIVYGSMDYPIGFTLNALIGSLLCMLGAGFAITKLSK